MAQFRVFTYRNSKTLRGENKGFTTIILMLSPANKSGYEVCAFSSPGCRAACLSTSGHGRYQRTQNAQIKRTKRFFEDREGFKADMIHDIRALIRKCEREGTTPCVRCNGCSDIDWMVEFPEVFSMFPNVQFYDYTKDIDRPFRQLPPNYQLTYSRSEDTPDTTVRGMLRSGVNVAIPFETVPSTFMGFPVLSGDIDDLRHTDKHGIVGLSCKGRAKKDKSGFVVRNSHPVVGV